MCAWPAHGRHSMHAESLVCCAALTSMKWRQPAAVAWSRPAGKARSGVPCSLPLDPNQRQAFLPVNAALKRRPASAVLGSRACAVASGSLVSGRPMPAALSLCGILDQRRRGTCVGGCPHGCSPGMHGHMEVVARPPTWAGMPGRACDWPASLTTGSFARRKCKNVLPTLPATEAPSAAPSWVHTGLSSTLVAQACRTRAS